MKRVAIFDLDGTLWKENSHVCIVESYYKIKGIRRIAFRLYGKLFPQKKMDELYTLIKSIPEPYINMYGFTINTQLVEKLHYYKRNGYSTYIVTNAPIQIRKKAEKMFRTKVIGESIGKKSRFLHDKEFDYLVIFTDNKTDIDIINISNCAYIVLNNSNSLFFRKNKKDNMVFL